MKRLISDAPDASHACHSDSEKLNQTNKAKSVFAQKIKCFLKRQDGMVYQKHYKIMFDIRPYEVQT